MIGFTLSPLIPIDYFGAGPLLLENNFSNIELSSKIGYQFGMLMINTKSKNITLEWGSLFCRRNFKFKGENNFISSSSSDVGDFGYINYAFPLNALVFIQLSDNMHMNTSLGAELDFYASAVASKSSQNLIHHYSERARWINGSVNASIGVEFRDRDAGIFYIASQVNIPISTILVTHFKYYYSGSGGDFDNYEAAFLRGNYFNIAGRVCMDQFMVDFGDIEPNLGDEVLIFGNKDNDEISVELIADKINSTTYVLLTAIQGRTEHILI